jgi:hypothetical protein
MMIAHTHSSKCVPGVDDDDDEDDSTGRYRERERYRIMHLSIFLMHCAI